jgi:hypothetical protein
VENSYPEKLAWKRRYGCFFYLYNQYSMQKQTVTFSSLEIMTQFSKILSGGYVLNTITLTLTARVTNSHLQQACDLYDAAMQLFP